MEDKLPPAAATSLPPVGPHGPPAGHPLVTPGWNDPPPITQSISHTGPKRILNKRVAFPLSTSVPPTGPPLANQMLEEVVANFKYAIGQSQKTSCDIMMEIDRISINWHGATCNDNIRGLFLQASRDIKNGNLGNAKAIHQQLSAMSASGWFTVFLHNVIMLLTPQCS